jgi:hypothetical protein
MASVSNKMGRKVEEVVEKKAGYHLYEDGVSRWGMNLYRGSKVGVEITREQHVELDTEKKVELYGHIISDMADAAAEKEKAKK